VRWRVLLVRVRSLWVVCGFGVGEFSCLLFFGLFQLDLEVGFFPGEFSVVGVGQVFGEFGVDGQEALSQS